MSVHGRKCGAQNLLTSGYQKRNLTRLLRPAGSGNDMNNNRVSGINGEELAASFLQKKGYKIIERNFRSRGGEIDIIAQEGDSLVFIEVKARSTDEFGSPLEAVTRWKMKSLIKTAQFYKLKHPKLPELMRIDAVAITLDNKNKAKSIELIKNISG